MSLDSTMTDVLAPSGGGRVKTGGELVSPFDEAYGKPGHSGGSAINDRNKAPFDKPRASGGVPVKFFEQVSTQPASLETTLEDTGLVR